MKSARLEWLDLCRGLAAVAVVLFHYRGPLGLRFIEFGNLAVDMFFVLSGIVLGRKYGRAIAAGMPFLAFAKARLIRLYPMTFLTGCFILAMTLAGLPGSSLSAVSSGMAWTVFLVTPLPGHWPMGVSFPPDPPVWSLWAELVTNAIWFFALRTWPRLTRAAWPWLLGGLFLLAWQHQTMGDGFQQGTRMLTFALVRALAWFSIGLAIATNTRPPLLSPAAAALLLAGACALYSHPPIPPWAMSFAIVAASALMLQALSVAAPPRPALASAARWLGMLSFPLYLTHLPAARLVPAAATGSTRVVLLLAAVAGVAVVATIAAEAVVHALQRLDRRAAAATLPVPPVAGEAGAP